MGFNNKRWLALVLTIIMVLGMGVPTAFAEEVSAKSFIGSKLAGLAFTGGDTADSLIIGAEGPAATIGLNQSGTVSFMVKERDPNSPVIPDRYVPFTATEFDLTAGNGSFTVTPHSMTELDGKTFLVIVDSGNNWYEAEFTVKVRPVLQANKASVELDKDDTKGMQSSTIGFTAKNAAGKTLVMDNMGSFVYYRADNSRVGTGGSGLLTSQEPMLLSDVKRANATSNFFTYVLSSSLLTPSRAGEGFIGFTGMVGDVPTMELLVPYKVSDSRLVGNDRPYRVGASIADVTIDRNRQISDITFEPFYYDVLGNQVYPRMATSDSDNTPGLSVLRSSIRAVSLDPDLVTVTGYNTSTGKFTLDWPAIGTAKPSGTTEILIFTNGVLSGRLKVTVNPIYVTPSPLTFTLNRANGGLKSQNVKLATSGTTGDNVVSFDVAASAPALVSGVPASVTANNVTVGLGTGTGDGKLTFSNIVLQTGIGLIPVPDCTADYHVVNTGATRAMTASTTGTTGTKQPITALTLDLASFGSDSAGIFFTPVTVSGKENAFVSGRDTLTWTGTPVVGGAPLIGAPTILADGSFRVLVTANNQIGTWNVVFSGTLNGEPIAPLTIPITVKDGTASAPNSIVANATVINKLTSDEFFEVSYELRDASNAAIPATAVEPFANAFDVNVKIVSPNRQTQDVVKVLPYTDNTTLTNKRLINFVITGAIGTSTVTLSDPNGRYPSTSFVVNVNPITFTTNVTSVTLDMASTATNTQDIALTSVNGFGLFNTGATWLPEGSTGPATVSVVRNNLVRLTGTELGKRTLRVYSYAETGLTGHEFVEIEVNVVNSQAIKVNSERFDFNLVAGGIVNGTLTVTGNPSTISLTTTAVTSSDSSVVTAVPNGSGGWTIAAQGVGSAVLTIYATDAQGNSWTREIPVTVQNTTAKPRIIANPTAVVLDIKEGTGQKLEETLTFSGANTTDSVIINSIISGNPAIATVTAAAPYTVKAVAKGTTTIEVKGTVNGLEAETLYVSVTVNDGTIVIAAGLYMDDATAPLSTSTSVINRIGYVKYPSVNVTKTVANTHTVVAKDASGNIVPITKVVNGTTSKVSAKVNADGTATVVLKTATGSTSVTFTAGGVDSKVKIGGKTQAIKKINEGAPAITIKVGQRLNVNPSFTPAYASNQRVSYKSNKTSVAKVSNGVLTGVSAGEAKLTITSKAKSSIKSVITVTVSADYSSVNYKSAYLVTDTNANEAAMAAILSASVSGTAAKLPGDSKAALVAALNAYANDATIKDEDVFTLYISGATSGNGLKIGSDVITFDDLAKELAKINGNIFLMMDCNSSSTVFTSKSLSEAETNNALIAAFAKANASIQAKTVTSATGNDRAKFKILTATSAKKQVTSSAKIFSEYLVKALTATDGKIAASGANKVTLTELYNYMVKNANPAAKTAGVSQRVGVYPAGDKFPVYAQAATVTP